MIDFEVLSPEDYIYQHKKWAQKRDSIREKNEALIEYWRNIPWYLWWKKLSFEEQRSIILENWRELSHY